MSLGLSNLSLNCWLNIIWDWWQMILGTGNCEIVPHMSLDNNYSPGSWFYSKDNFNSQTHWELWWFLKILFSASESVPSDNYTFSFSDKMVIKTDKYFKIWVISPQIILSSEATFLKKLKLLINFSHNMLCEKFNISNSPSKEWHLISFHFFPWNASWTLSKKNWAISTWPPPVPGSAGSVKERQTHDHSVDPVLSDRFSSSPSLLTMENDEIFN